MRGDFHIHTSYSDGVLNVFEVLEYAKDKLDIISITDHDCLDGSKIAYQNQDKYQIKVIIGSEISTYYKGESVHILAYFKDLENISKLEDILIIQRQNRVNRLKEIARRLELYFKIKLDLTELLKRYSITRGSIANEIVRQYPEYSKAYIFENFIGDNCSAYIPSTKISTEEIIPILKESHAVVVLAHPILLKKVSYNDIIKMGVDGIEAKYPLNKIEDTKKYIHVAKKNKLLITAGSDFHSFNDYKHGNLGEFYCEGEDLENFIQKIME